MSLESREYFTNNLPLTKTLINKWKDYEVHNNSYFVHQANRGGLGKSMCNKINWYADFFFLSFHVGTGCYDSTAHAEATKDAHKVFRIGKDVGFNFYLLDIGGGYPGDDDVLFEQICANLNEVLDDLFPWDSGIEIIAEPGTLLVKSSVTLVASVIAKKKTGLIYTITHKQLG